MRAYSGMEQVVQKGLYTEVGLVNHHDDDLAHDLVHQIGDAVGYWPLLAIIVAGAGVTFRKKIRKWIVK